MSTFTGKALIDQMNKLQVQPSCLGIWGLGQMGLAVKGAGDEIVYIDPVLTDVVAIRIPSVADKFSRAFPPPIEAHEISNAHLVLCTHEHLDHTDPLTLSPLAKASPQAKFVVSAWASDLMDEASISEERRIIPKLGTPIEMGNLRITAIPAAHEEMEIDPKKGSRFWSYLIEWNGVRLFHSGDTCITNEYMKYLRSLPPVDIAMVAANGRDEYRKSLDVLGNLHPVELVWVAKELGWDTIIAGHNDLYKWNTILAGLLADAVGKLNPRQKYRCQLQPGELYYYVK